jgi:hypothetical protein
MSRQPDRKTWPDDLIPDDQWRIYAEVIRRARTRDIPFALGGGFAIAAYTGHWRNTKDIDLYVLPENSAGLIEATREAGLRDLYADNPYDRRWIYRAACGEIIVDIIWAMANLRAQVDPHWLEMGASFHLRGENLAVVPPEEMLWNKLYVLQHDRTDWTDVVNLMYAVGEDLDWDRLITRLDDDLPLLAGALSVYRWLCPGRSRRIPAHVWESTHVAPPPRHAIPEIDWHHVALLDLRPWFPLVESR